MKRRCSIRSNRIFGKATSICAMLAVLFGCATTQASLGASRPVSLSWFARRHGFTHSTRGNKEYLRGKDHLLVFEGDSRRAEFNGTFVWLSDAVGKKWGRLTVSQRDIDKTIMPLIRPDIAIGRRGHRTVILDPGHGGSDLGAVGRRNVQEKRVVLDIARRARSLLTARGVHVELTRSDDRSMSLSERMELVSARKPDIFVSIHINAAASASASGVETHITPPRGSPITSAAKASSRDNTLHPNNYYDEANMLLGYHLQHAMRVRLKRQDRGLRRSRFFVTRNAPCPAALVECGFVSNREEEELFLDPRYRQAVAQAITDGIMNYFNEIRNIK